MARIAARPFRSGGGTRTWRSNLPGRKMAGSRMDIRFVAAITITRTCCSVMALSDDDGDDDGDDDDE